MARERIPHPPAAADHRAAMSAAIEKRVTPVVKRELQCLSAQIEVVGRLLTLAKNIRRTNPNKWGLSLIDWQIAIKHGLHALETGDSEAGRQASRLARSAVRPL